ncbi:MAG: hypothetical protein SFW67_10900 [Myxococcaceae bacterium]|nr:hypothetical protein [Myxococcaceae bacterium]
MSLPADARCPEHPDSAAIASCQRCGRFVCGADAQVLLKGTFCDACATRPEVSFLDAFKRAHFGVRDGWAWLFGMSGLAALLSAALLATMAFDGRAAGPELAAAGLLCAYGVLGVAFFFGVSSARWGLVGFGALCAVFLLATEGPWAILLMVPPGLFVAAALASVPNRLFFRLEVPVATLEREWRRRYDNPGARQAVSWALLGALLPLFLPIALVSAIIALLKVNPTAQPPIGGRPQALFALAVTVVALALWGLAFSTGRGLP